MKMTWRWYGEGNDQIKLSDIKQIPGVEGIVWALHDKMPGEVWQPEEIAKVKAQLDEFNRVMKHYSKAKGQKIVFIHGKGEGVLRQALLKELKLKYKQCDVQDASFREYGFGATQVTIR